jgi:hypothetical protein
VLGLTLISNLGYNGDYLTYNAKEI